MTPLFDKYERYRGIEVSMLTTVAGAAVEILGRGGSE
jgi:hypothetical protein